MDLGPPPRRATAEPVVAMINVVFLLLCFFMMTATLVRPSPFEVAPPVSEDCCAQLLTSCLDWLPPMM